MSEDILSAVLKSQPKARSMVRGDEGSIEIMTGNYPYRTFLKSGYVEEVTADSLTGESKVYFEDPFPHVCLSVTATPEPNDASVSKVYTITVSDVDASGFKPTYKCVSQGGTITTVNKPFRWVAVGY